MVKPLSSSSIFALLLRAPERQCTITSSCLRFSSPAICAGSVPRGIRVPPILNSSYSCGSLTSIMCSFSPLSIRCFSSSVVISVIISFSFSEVKLLSGIAQTRFVSFPGHHFPNGAFFCMPSFPGDGFIGRFCVLLHRLLQLPTQQPVNSLV